MKALHSIAVIIIFISTAFTQQNKDDWPNLNRYQSDNENVKKGKKKSPRVVFIGNSITEGIGTARITKNFEKAIIDDAFQTDDTEALNIVYDLIEKQKIILGGSSGINIAGAIKLAKKMGPGKNIVTILCDHGKRYASKIFNKDFLKSKNLPIPKWL